MAVDGNVREPASNYKSISFGFLKSNPLPTSIITATLSTTQVFTMVRMSKIPSKTQILVLGGGPAGSFAASVLVREGYEVTVLEAAQFPRYHVGESLLPSVASFLDFIGALDKVRNHGFIVKPGGAVKFNQHKREGYTDFVSTGHASSAFQVIRSEFDEILLQHASDLGATVCENTHVNEILFDGTSGRPVSATYVQKIGEDRVEGEIAFEWLVDASGRNGLMSTKYRKDRIYNENLQNMAVWGYWDNVDKYDKGGPRENSIWVEALTDETGWTWCIPLHDGTHSVGVVMDKNVSAVKRQQAGTLENHYLDCIKLSPKLSQMLKPAMLNRKKYSVTLRMGTDYSYRAKTFGGEGYRIAGDAAAFIDPFFSSGVHLAMTGALSAAVTILASIKGEMTEEKANDFHNRKIGTAYTRFLLVVMGSYKQMRNQNIDILSHIDEDNFDRAFHLIRPIIQGLSEADVTPTVTREELDRTMDFLAHTFSGDHEEVQRAIDANILDGELLRNGNLTEGQIAAIRRMKPEHQNLVKRIESKRPFVQGSNVCKGFSGEEILGAVVRMLPGNLGINFIGRTTLGD